MVGQALKFISAFALVRMALANTEHRRLGSHIVAIAGYVPGSDVIQHNRIDLDQEEMEKHLGGDNPNFAKAGAIYNNGAHSGAYARLTVPGIATDLAKSLTASQEGNSAAAGYIKKAKSAGATQVDVTYTSTCVDNEHSDSRDVTGCFIASGEVTVDGTMNIGTPQTVENKYRTLAGFSTAAADKMQGQETFEKFRNYYGSPDYAHQYVTAALEGTGIWAGKDNAAKVQGVKKGSAYMNVWMYVIREMEDAEDDCQAGCIDCNDDPVHAWDEAVAFYTGTKEGTTFVPGSGKLLYALADKRCINFGTCDGMATSGTSMANMALFDQFNLGRDTLQGGRCSEIPPIKNRIIAHMTIPLIQGALRYAQRVADMSGDSKAQAEGAVFSAAVLPMIHSCNSAAATTISDNMRIDVEPKMKDGFAAVKAAFESTYSCLGITCQQVGGLRLNDWYYDGATPCGAWWTTTTTAVGQQDASSAMHMVSGLLSVALASLLLQF